MSAREQIRELLLNHPGKINMITAPAIAENIGIEPGPSGVEIRELITETIITYHLPVASSSRGYYLLEDSDDLKRYQKSLDGRTNKITMKGVEFKVLGTDDKGYTKVMYPGYDYIFPGARYVVEKPMKND